MPGLDRIEDLLRFGEPPPEDTDLVLRGGPLAAEKFLEHAKRQQRLHSYQGEPMASISVSATVGGWTVETILAGPLLTRSRFAVCRIGTLQAAGYEILATGPVPHFDILLNEASMAECRQLLARFSAAHDNPFKRRR